MAQHFEELWEQCELFHQENEVPASPVSALLEELSLKLGLYQALDTQKDNLPVDYAEVKTRMLGEILLTLTNLSLRDNINVYQALAQALQHRSVQVFQVKHRVP